MATYKYVRISSIQQNDSRQLENSNRYDSIIKDKISGTIPFNKRPGGKKIINGVLSGEIDSVSFHDASRVGRNVKDTLWVIDFLKENNCRIFFEAEGLEWKKGGNNDIFDLTTTILAAVYQMEKRNILERTHEGRKISQIKHPEKWIGRRKGTKDSNDKTLQKHSDIVKLLKKGTYTMAEIQKLTSKGITTVYKVRNILNEN